MKNFQEWSEDKDIKKNYLGGMDPKTPDQIKIFKKVDLLTLPEKVSGTNCFNCGYIKKDKSDIGFCTNEQVKQHVTDRNCCALWSREDAYRSWKKDDK